MPENGTCSLGGGRRPARQRASSDPTGVKVL
jgi:RNA-directed DNA polymerase